MDNSMAQSIEQTFGKTFLQYCLHNKILLKRDKCGAFEVSGTSNNIRTLSDCLYIIDNIKSETDKKLKKLQKEALTADYSPYSALIKARTKTNKNKVKNMSKRKCVSIYDK